MGLYSGRWKKGRCGFFHLIRLAAMAVMGLQQLKFLPAPLFCYHSITNNDQSVIKRMTCTQWIDPLTSFMPKSITTSHKTANVLNKAN